MNLQNLGIKNLKTEAMFAEVREDLCSEKMIFSKLYAENGPLVQVDKVWPLLGFNSRDTFNRTADKRRIPLHVIRPAGRRKSFFCCHNMMLSRHLATLSLSEEEKPTRKSKTPTPLLLRMPTSPTKATFI